MSLSQFAYTELKAAGLLDDDSDYDGMIGTAVLQLIDTLSKQGHSGGSIGITLSIFNDVARYKPLSPLTGNDDEWTDVSEASGRPMWQNKRRYSVFKGADGLAYDLDAVVYRTPEGGTFHKGGELHYIRFPYTPKVTVIDVTADGEPLNEIHVPV